VNAAAQCERRAGRMTRNEIHLQRLWAELISAFTGHVTAAIYCHSNQITLLYCPQSERSMHSDTAGTNIAMQGLHLERICLLQYTTFVSCIGFGNRSLKRPFLGVY